MAADISTDGRTVFLSYATVDRPHALVLYELLARRYSVFMDAKSMVGGERWSPVLERALGECSVVVAHCTNAAWDEPRWMRREILFAEQQKKPIIPVLVEGTLPLELIDRVCIDGRVPVEQFGADLLAAVAFHIEPVAARRDVDRLLGATLRAQLEGDATAAASAYREATSLDAKLPRTLAEAWAKVRPPVGAPAITLEQIVFVEETEKLATSRYADGRTTYRWSVRIDATRDVLGQIAHVDYDLSPYFASGVRLIRARDTGFELSQYGWGPIAFRVAIVLTDGRTLSTWVDITLKGGRTPAPTDPFPLV